jgi:4-amino-4-deoxy-L-arabinose transferase-like glycosyltransferase
VIALGWNLGGYQLLDPDEGRNAEIAREMAETNDYLLPHLNGLPYLDKPVVYFAAAAAAMELLGPHETAARLPALIATLATILLVVWFARRRWGGEAGWLAGIALATMPLALAYARTTIFDSTLSFFTTAAILAFFLERPAVGWAAVGAGALTKGPVAILIVLVTIIPYRALTGQPVRRVFGWRGLLAFAAVALPWFFFVTRRIPDFPHYVFVRETFERVTTPSFHRTGPWWYYLPILPVAAFPWTVPALARLGGGRLRIAWSTRAVNAAAREPLLLACWILGPLLFFSLNQSKLPQYILPLLPAFALGAGRNIAAGRMATAGWRSYLAIAGALVVALLAAERFVSLPITMTEGQRLAIPLTALALAGTLAVSALAVWAAARRDSVSLAAAGFALVVFTVPFVAQRLMRAVGEDRSAGQLADAVRGRGEVVLIGTWRTSLPFYLGRQLRIATASGKELTSNWIADHVEEYRALPDTPILAADGWRALLATCPVATVFITARSDSGTRAALSPLPLLFEDARNAAFGPCTPGVPR